MVGLLLILSFVFLLLMGVPIAIALIIPAIAYAMWSGFPLSAIAQTFTYALDSFPLLAVPLFILVGNLMNSSGVTTRLFRFANVLVSHWRGGLAQVNILASLIFSGSSGAALADIGGIGTMEVKAMREAGYKREFAAALTAASATIGPLFPPSVPLIIFAAVAQTSSVQLLLAGILPAVLTTVALMLLTAFLARKRGYPKGSTRPAFKELWTSFWSALPALLTPVVLIAGMLSGIFTATEAAAVTVVYIILINFVVYRDFKWSNLRAATWNTVHTTSVLMVMVAAAALFTRMLALEQMPQTVARLLLSLSTEPLVLLLIANVLLILAGLFLETISAILLLAPLLVPPLTLAGVDPVHLGLVVVFNLMVGLLTPPMGMSLYLVSNIARVPVSKVLKEVLPYYIPLFAMLLVLTYFPALSLWIPSLVQGR